MACSGPVLSSGLFSHFIQNLTCNFFFKICMHMGICLHICLHMSRGLEIPWDITDSYELPHGRGEFWRFCLANCFGFSFDTGFLSVALAVHQAGLNSQRSTCFCLPVLYLSGIKGLCHYAQFRKNPYRSLEIIIGLKIILKQTNYITSHKAGYLISRNKTSTKDQSG